MHNHSVGKSPKNVSLFLVFVYRKSFSIFVQKSCKKMGSGYSKIFQLMVWASKLYFRDLKLIIDEENLIYRS